MDLPVAASQTLIVPSPEPDTIHRPSGEYASDHTTFPRVEGGEWEGRSVGLAMLMLSAVDHMRTVSSIEPDTTWRPSGEKLTDNMESVCPLNGSPTISHVIMFQIQILSSADPVTIRLPSEEREREERGKWRMGKGKQKRKGKEYRERKKREKEEKGKEKHQKKG